MHLFVYVVCAFVNETVLFSYEIQLLQMIICKRRNEHSNERLNEWTKQPKNVIYCSFTNSPESGTLLNYDNHHRLNPSLHQVFLLCYIFIIATPTISSYDAHGANCDHHKIFSSFTHSSLISHFIICVSVKWCSENFKSIYSLYVNRCVRIRRVNC